MRASSTSTVPIGVSVGLATCRADAMARNGLIERAGQTLRLARERRAPARG